MADILPKLQQMFPHCQFIVTTYSPQVVSSAPAECVRITSHGEVVPFDAQTQGVESQLILAEIFGTSSVPQGEPWVVLLNQYANLETHGQADTPEARGIYERLVEHLGEIISPYCELNYIANLWQKNGGRTMHKFIRHLTSACLNSNPGCA